MFRSFRAFFAFVAFTAGAAAQAAPDHVDITWMSITNMYFELGDQKIVADGYITRLPEELFQRTDSIYGKTVRTARPDVAAVKEVGLKVPLVVRLEGTNVELGKKILNESGLAVIAADNLADAAEKIVKAVRGN